MACHKTIMLLCVAAFSAMIAGCGSLNSTSAWTPVALKQGHPSPRLTARIRSALDSEIHRLERVHRTDTGSPHLKASYHLGDYETFKEVGGDKSWWIFATLEEHGADGANQTDSLAILHEHHGNMEVIRQLNDGEGLLIDGMFPQVIWNAVTHQAIIAYYMYWTPHGGAGPSSLFVTEVKNSGDFKVLCRVRFPEHDRQFTVVRISSKWTGSRMDLDVHVPPTMVSRSYCAV